jgi:predicted GNAT family N-acyltransferase
MTERVVNMRIAHWSRDRASLMTVRLAVFVEEQGVPRELEQDESDPDCRHLLAFSADGAPVGTARLTPAGQIGRMAVLREWRGRGVGRRLLNCLLDIAAQSGRQEVFLNAQCTAGAFYRLAGFRPTGPVFEEAGIPHQRMSKRLATT